MSATTKLGFANGRVKPNMSRRRAEHIWQRDVALLREATCAGLRTIIMSAKDFYSRSPRDSKHTDAVWIAFEMQRRSSQNRESSTLKSHSRALRFRPSWFIPSGGGGGGPPRR